MSKATIEIKEKVKVIHRGYLLWSFIQLAKLNVTVFVALSAFFGFLLFDGFQSNIYLSTFAVFFTAIASSAFNQIQERKYDKLMERTRKRPLPSNKLTREESLIFSIFCTLAGLFLIGLTLNIVAIALTIFSMLWYNLIYTPLKRKTAIAVLPGALMGATPPIIGWVAAGGDFLNPKILFIASFFFIWQIPHFWFLFLIYNDDYKKAGYPTLKDIFTLKQIGNISFIWIVALALIATAYPMFFYYQNVILFSIIFVSSVIIVWRNKFLLSLENSNEIALYRRAFRDINIYVLCIVLILTIDKLLAINKWL
jgi:protoheme IX farnesyltransferase